MVSSFSASEINQQPALRNDFLIVGLITEWTQPDYDKQIMDQLLLGFIYLPLCSLRESREVSVLSKGNQERRKAKVGV